VLACLAGAWSRLIGDRLADVCRPVRFENSELTIEVSDINWAKAIKSIKLELAEKMRAATAGEVRSVVVVSRLGTVGSG